MKTEIAEKKIIMIQRRLGYVTLMHMLGNMQNMQNMQNQT